MKYAVVRHGEDLRHLLLVWRKERLRRLIDRNKCAPLMFAQHIPTKGTALFKQVCHWDMEAIVCKKKDGAYRSGWLKVLNPARWVAELAQGFGFDLANAFASYREGQ